MITSPRVPTFRESSKVSKCDLQRPLAFRENSAPKNDLDVIPRVKIAGEQRTVGLSNHIVEMIELQIFEDSEAAFIWHDIYIRIPVHEDGKKQNIEINVSGSNNKYNEALEVVNRHH